MGNVYFSIVATEKYLKCDQVQDMKQSDFPQQVLLEHNQMNFVQIVSDSEYNDALNAYKEKQSDKKKEEKKEEDKKENALFGGLALFRSEYTFDADPECVIIGGMNNKTLRTENEGTLAANGGIEESSRWIVEFDGGDKYQRITLKNMKSEKYLRIFDDGKSVDVKGDDNNHFKVIAEQKNTNCIKLESCSFDGKYIAIDAEKGVFVADDKTNNSTDLTVWKQLEISIGFTFKMGDISYSVQSIGDIIKCQQNGDNKQFPDIIYLEENQFNFVQIEHKKQEEPKKKEIKKEEKVATPSSPTQTKIAMFEQKEKEKPKKKKENVTTPGKMRVSGLNRKFGGLNINPAALKPGAANKAKKYHGKKEKGEMDQKPKVEQAVITKGKRKRRKHTKKKVILEEEGNDAYDAPQLFYDEEAVKKREKEEAAKRKKANKGKKGGKGGKAGKGGEESVDAPPGGGGSCCVVL